MNRLILLFAHLVLAVAASAQQQPSVALRAEDVGKIWFAAAGSITKATEDGRYALSDEPVLLSGDLQFPAGPGPFAAIVLAHGCAGLGYGERTWVPLLHQWGYATFVVDSFSGRGIKSICEEPWRLLSVQRVPDVYGALRMLATHPKIDANAIFLMGFSHGGALIVNAATVWARDTYAAAGRPRFRGFFPFYPYCNNSFPEREAISAPLRIHTGELDDWTPAKPCKEWVDRLKVNGYDARITLYSGAHHAFDTPFGFVIRLPGVQNGASCRAQFPSILGPFDIAKNFSGCIVRGATAGRNADAIEQAAQALRSQLAEILNAK